MFLQQIGLHTQAKLCQNPVRDKVVDDGSAVGFERRLHVHAQQQPATPFFFSFSFFFFFLFPLFLLRTQKAPSIRLGDVA